MGEKTEVNAVELVRSIRDQQAELLAGKSNEEIIEFFRQAGATARGETNSAGCAGGGANELKART